MARRNPIPQVLFLVLPLALWPFPAQAQDITGLILVVAPAALLAPFAALGLKILIARDLPRRGLIAIALLELVIWVFILPAGSLTELRFLGLDWKHSAGAMLLLCPLAALSVNALLIKRPSGTPRIGIAFCFMLLTPVCFVAMSFLVWGLLSAGGF